MVELCHVSASTTIAEDRFVCVFLKVLKRQERRRREEDHLQKGDELVKLDGTPGPVPAVWRFCETGAGSFFRGQVKEGGKLATSFQI